MFCIRHKRVILALVLTVLTAAFAALGVMFSMSQSHKQMHDEERLRLAAVYPETANEADVDGFVLNILCSKDARDLLYGEGSSEDLVLRGVSMRNAHLETETGVHISITGAEDFYKVAKDDILSGAHQYELYAASCTDGLSRLLAEGMLHDISDSKYIDTSNEWYDAKTIDNLSVFGKKYLISSDISDARWWSYALAYDNSTEAASLADVAKNGELTLEGLLERGNVLAKDSDMYPFWFSVGGFFVKSGDDGLEFIKYSEFKNSVEYLSLLDKQSEEKDFRFSLVTLYDLYGADNAGLLPLPKRNSEYGYRSYIDLDNALLLAIPEHSASKGDTEYVVDRMAALSAEYVAPYFVESFNSNAEMYDIITESAECDLTSLFGYGDMDGLVASLVKNGSRTALEYYNRKELYTKALDIVKKRLADNK